MLILVVLKLINVMQILIDVVIKLVWMYINGLMILEIVLVVIDIIENMILNNIRVFVSMIRNLNIIVVKIIMI